MIQHLYVIKKNQNHVSCTNLLLDVVIFLKHDTPSKNYVKNILIIGPVTPSHVCNSTGNFGSLFLNPNFPIKLYTVSTATSGNKQLVLPLHKQVGKFLAI